MTAGYKANDIHSARRVQAAACSGGALRTNRLSSGMDDAAVDELLDTLLLVPAEA